MALLLRIREQVEAFVQVLQAGYVMHDRLLRPALVGVAKGDPKPANDAPDHVDTVA